MNTGAMDPSVVANCNGRSGSISHYLCRAKHVGVITTVPGVQCNTPPDVYSSFLVDLDERTASYDELTVGVNTRCRSDEHLECSVDDAFDEQPEDC